MQVGRAHVSLQQRELRKELAHLFSDVLLRVFQLNKTKQTSTRFTTQTQHQSDLVSKRRVVRETDRLAPEKRVALACE
jgi:hypothetical protein